MTDWVEITALIAGPVFAVGLTLWREKLRDERTRKLGITRQLLLTRHFPEDPAFTAAIRLVPIEFGRSPAVMTAWENFEHAANQQAMNASYTDDLVVQMMLDLGYSKRAASQAARSNYVATGLAGQRQLNEGVLKGVVTIADASRRSAQASVAMAEHIIGKPLPPIPADEAP